MNGFRAGIVFALVSLTNGPSWAIQSEPILLINQPTGPKESAIDLTDYVSRDLSRIQGFQPIVFKATLPAIKDAIASNGLTEQDLKQPLSPQASRKIARALGMRQLLRLSGKSTPEGVTAEAELERLSGQAAWGVVFSQKLEPYKTKGAKPTLLEGIKAQVALIVQRLTGSPVQVQTQDPVSIKVDPKDSKKDSKKPENPSRENPQPQPPDSEIQSPPKTTSPPAAQAPAPPPYELQADRYRREGDQANLIISLRKAINDKPREVKLRRELIQAYALRGWHSAAKDEAARAVSLAPDDGPLRRILGEAFLAGGDAESALTELGEAVRINPSDVTAHVAIGDIHFASARLEEAEKAYSAAATADAKSPLPHRRRARIYVDRGQFPEALKSLATVHESLKPDEADSLILDYAAMLTVLESGLGETLGRLQANRQALLDGSKTREQAFTFGMAQRKRAEEITAFLDAMPPIPILSKVQRLYGQAAGFVTQAAEAALAHVENPDTKRDQEASLLRLEATRAISDASKRLKSTLKP